MIKITSLEQLKAWNANPTKEKPVVLEWFMDWFFSKLVDKQKYREAQEARDVLVEFTMKCEGYNEEEAKGIVRTNLTYFAGYAARWGEGLEKVYRYVSIPVTPKEYRKGILLALKDHSLAELSEKILVPEDKIIEYLKEKP